MKHFFGRSAGKQNNDADLCHKQENCSCSPKSHQQTGSEYCTGNVFASIVAPFRRDLARATRKSNELPAIYHEDTPCDGRIVQGTGVVFLLDF